jgi:tetratricopeptide (TPR) repeat protein
MHCSKYFVIGKYKEAERVLSEAIKELPDDPLLYYSLGVLLGRINRLQVQS